MRIWPVVVGATAAEIVMTEVFSAPWWLFSLSWGIVTFGLSQTLGRLI